MINLFISLYPEKNRERQNELVECLKRNSKVFDKVFILAEQSEEIEFIPELENVIVLPVTVRPTFRTFFNCINTVSKIDDINCVCNGDIYFEPFTKFPQPHECFALCRYEIKKNGPTTFLNRFDSQDAFLFKGHIRIPKYADFFALPGSDNRICYELKEIGYHMSNPSLTIKCYHLHEGQKSYDGTQKVNRPYHFIHPSE